MSTNIKNPDGSLTKIAGKTLQYPVNTNIGTSEALQDAPVGHIISYMGTIAPIHYLACDGSTYNIADYPKLADHFLVNFGSKNYFGGDGTTTFGVPDLRGEFLRGTGTNSHADQGSGANIGEHQNATLNPYYGISSQNRFQTYSIGNVNNFVTNRDSEQVQSGSSSIANMYRTSPLENSATTATFTNYTSRPTNTSVLYCIKAEPTYFMEMSDPGYSTDEVFTSRTWIDGKPIYRKVFTELKATVPNDYTYYDFSMHNIDEVISTTGFAYNIGDGYVISQPIPWITGAAKTIEISYNKTSKYLQIYCNQGTGEHDGYFYNAPLTIILEYTKTTD